MSEETPENKALERIKQEAVFNALFTLDVMRVMNPVINDLKIEIAKLKEELEDLRYELLG